MPSLYRGNGRRASLSSGWTTCTAPTGSTRRASLTALVRLPSAQPDSQGRPRGHDSDSCPQGAEDDADDVRGGQRRRVCDGDPERLAAGAGDGPAHQRGQRCRGSTGTISTPGRGGLRKTWTTTTPGGLGRLGQ